LKNWAVVLGQANHKATCDSFCAQSLVANVYIVSRVIVQFFLLGEKTEKEK